MTAAAKLKKDRAILDNRVVKYIKLQGLRGCRLMSLAMNHGRKKDQFEVPRGVWIDHERRVEGVGHASRREMIMQSSLKRLKKQGRIRCDKRGTPCWLVVPEDDQATTAAKLAFDKRVAKTVRGSA